MPEFSNSFSGNNNPAVLSEDELIRAVRFEIAAEYEAVQLYKQLAASTANRLVKKVLTDIANEERVHAGELLQLLKILAPDEQKYYDKGAREVQKTIQDQSSQSSTGSGGSSAAASSMGAEPLLSDEEQEVPQNFGTGNFGALNEGDIESGSASGDEELSDSGILQSEPPYIPQAQNTYQADNAAPKFNKYRY